MLRWMIKRWRFFSKVLMDCKFSRVKSRCKWLRFLGSPFRNIISAPGLGCHWTRERKARVRNEWERCVSISPNLLSVLWCCCGCCGGAVVGQLNPSKCGWLTPVAYCINIEHSPGISNNCLSLCLPRNSQISCSLGCFDCWIDYDAMTHWV